MIDTSVTNLMLEVNRSQEETRKKYSAIQKQQKRMSGLPYEGKEGVIEPVNYAWSYTLHTVARLSAGDMLVKFTTKRPTASERVEGNEAFCAQWGPDTGWERERERLMVDSCFGTHVAIVKQEPRPGFEYEERPVMTPRAHRISPGMFGIDRDAFSADDARFLWHKLVYDKNDLDRLADTEPGWNKDAINQLHEESVDAAKMRGGDHGGRTALVCYSVWVRGYLPPEFEQGLDPRERARYSGTIFTIANVSAGGLELRAPQPNFGHKDGPYAVGGLMFVPDESWMLGALTACDGQIQQMNAQARANDVAAERRKRITLLDGIVPDQSAAVTSAKDGDILTVAGVDASKVVDIEVGGISAEARARELDLKARTDEALGLSDQVRGNATGVGTATENVIAAQSNQTISGYSDRKFQAFEKEVYKRVSFFFDQDYRTAIRRNDEIFVGGMTLAEQRQGTSLALANGLISQDEAQAAIEQLSAREQAGEPEPVAYDDLDLDIESVKSGQEQQAALSNAMNIVGAVAGILPVAAPFMPGLDAFMQRIADTLEISELASLFSLQAAQDAAQQAAQAAQSQPEPRTVPGPKMPTPTPRPTGNGNGTSMQRPEVQSLKLRTGAASK